MTDKAVKAVAAHCPGLPNLNASGCAELTDEAAKSVAAHCTGLTCLNAPGRGIAPDEVVGPRRWRVAATSDSRRRH